MKIAHGFQSGSVAGEDFDSPEALIDSIVPSARLECVEFVDNPYNCILELLGLQCEFALEGIMRP